MKRNLAYLYYVLLHKYYVYLAGRALGLGWKQLLLHDVSKFRADEWGPYSRRFYDENGRARVLDSSPEWRMAWFLHQRRNPHHHQFWVVANPELERYQMPQSFVKEMVADWAGAGRVKTGSWEGLWDWSVENMPEMQLHAGTVSQAWQFISQLRHGPK